jgi:hypothetical protein
MNHFLSLNFVTFTVPLLGAVVAWLVNQWQQRSRDEYLRKEKLYRDLLDALQGFYESPTSVPISSTTILATDQQKTKRQEFLNQLGLAWLYAPDPVIEQAHIFLDTVHAGRQPLATDREKEIALGNVVAAIREDPFRPGLNGLETLEAAGRRLSTREAELTMTVTRRFEDYDRKVALGQMAADATDWFLIRDRLWI